MRRYKKYAKLKMRLTLAMMIVAGFSLTSLSVLISIGTYNL